MKYFVYLFMIAGLLHSSFSLKASNEDKERLEFLQQQAGKVGSVEISVPNTHLYRAEALLQNDTTHLLNAYYMLTRHYYSNNTDSMRYWIEYAVPLYIQTGNYETACRLLAWDIYKLNMEKKNDEVLTAVNKLRELSTQLRYPEGYEMADQALADYYITNGLFEDGETLYMNVYKRMEERGAPLVKRYNIIRQLLVKAPNDEIRFKYLKMVEDILAWCKKEGIEELDAENPLYSIEFYVYRSYASSYTNKDSEKALYYLKKAEKIVNEHNLTHRKSEINHLYYSYYLHRNKLDSAFIYGTLVANRYRERNTLDHLYDVLKNQVYILTELGKYKDATIIYDEILMLNDTIRKQEYLDQLVEVRTKYEVERLELEKDQIKTQAEQAHSRMTISIVGSIILLIVIAVLIRMMMTIQRHRREMRLAKEKAEESDRMKSTFLANMNHEIRTPLNAIVGFSQVLIDEDDKDQREEFAQIIENNNELLQRLIGDVLDISKIESNSMSLIYSEQDLPFLVREIYSMIRLRMQSNVDLILEPCLPCTLEIDRNRLVQVLTNLLTNAMKHTAKGHIRMGYELTDKMVRFFVEDTGEGIPPEQLQSIFNRFVQLESGKKGVGLGLAICKGLVEKMGGTIWVTSEVGAGSTFYVEVPIKKPA